MLSQVMNVTIRIIAVIVIIRCYNNFGFSFHTDWITGSGHLSVVGSRERLHVERCWHCEPHHWQPNLDVRGDASMLWHALQSGPISSHLNTVTAANTFLTLDTETQTQICFSMHFDSSVILFDLMTCILKRLSLDEATVRSKFMWIGYIRVTRVQYNKVSAKKNNK